MSDLPDIAGVRVVAGGMAAGTRVHAVMVTTYVDGTRHARTLCGVGRFSGLRFGDRDFSGGEEHACRDCAREHAARWETPIPGWDRTCESCGRAKPITQFSADARCADGLSKRCYDCKDAARRVAQEAARITAEEAIRTQVGRIRRERARVDAAKVAHMQRGAHLPTVGCPTCPEVPQPWALDTRVVLVCASCGWSGEAPPDLIRLAEAAFVLSEETEALLVATDRSDVR